MSDMVSSATGVAVTETVTGVFDPLEYPLVVRDALVQLGPQYSECVGRRRIVDHVENVVRCNGERDAQWNFLVEDLAHELSANHRRPECLRLPVALDHELSHRGHIRSTRVPTQGHN